MKCLRLLIVLLALCSSARVRADYRFTWRDGVYTNFQIFYGSFDITDAEFANFQSPTFFNSIYFSNILSGYSFRYDAPWSSVSGSLDPSFRLQMVHHDSTHLASLDLYADGPTMTGYIGETDPDGHSWIEHGYWTYHQIPEPSVASLAVLGIALVFLSRRECLEHESFS